MNRRTLKSIIYFFCIGITNLFFSYAVYELIYLFSPYWVAYSLSYLAAVIYSYLGNSFLSFSTKVSYRKFLHYFIFHLASYSLSMSFAILARRVLHVNGHLLPLVVAPLMSLVNFLGMRSILRKERVEESVKEES